MATDDGQALFGSQVIAEYLDALSAPRLVPAEGRPRLDALRRQALADGILDAGVSIVLEGRRPESERSLGWVQRQTEVVVRALDAFEGEISRFGDGLTIGHIALGCALGWLDFRIPGHEWRSRCFRLAAWFAAFSQRPSMLATKPA
jgi:glutathione S-transferase